MANAIDFTLCFKVPYGTRPEWIYQNVCTGKLITSHLRVELWNPDWVLVGIL